MKKIINLLLVLTLVFLLIGCQDTGSGEKNELYDALPEAKSFTQVDITNVNLPESVTEIYKDNAGAGYVVKLVTRGYAHNFVIVVGISPDGVVKGAICLQSNETNGAEKTYGDSFVGKDINGVKDVDLVAGSTITTSAYKKAVVDAFTAFETINETK